MPPKVSGKVPINSLKLKSNTVKFFNRPISAGTQDLKPLFMKIISSKLDILPRLAGTQPWNLLLASTMTETGEFPKLSGNSKENLLWLMNMASSGLSNNSGGTVPSNSLNLISRKINLGKLNTT